MSKDYYKILGVEKNASEAEIKAAFRKLAHEHHPDKANGNEAKFKEINEAYQVLGNKEKRQQYDQFGTTFDQQGGFGQGMGWDDFMRAARSGANNGFGNINFDFGGMDLGDIFGDVFGFGSRRRSAHAKASAAKGDDIQIDLSLEFNDAIFGAKKQVELYKDVQCGHCHGNQAEPGTRLMTCSTCNGQGFTAEAQRTFFGVFQSRAVCSACQGQGKIPEKKCAKCRGQGIVKKNEIINIDIPAGVEDGMTLKISGHGQVGLAGAGDLYINIRVKPSRDFKRRGNDLFAKTQISFKQAALGATIEIKTADGSVDLKIPAGTQPNTSFRLKNKGVPHLHGNTRGDMYVEVAVEVPRRLSRKQKEILEEFDE